MHSNEMIDAWLAGELQGEALLRFESHRASDPDFASELALEQRSRKSLKRSFDAGREPLGGVEAVLKALRPVQDEPLGKPGASVTAVATWLAAAAGFLLLLAQFDGPRRQSPMRLLPGEVSMLPAPQGLSAFEGAKQLDGGRLVPNIEGILCAAAHFAERSVSEQCDAPEARQGLGQAVGLSSAALGVLQGPIMASEWPGSMVFTSQDSGGRSLLIAGQDGLNTCCLDVRAPKGSNLRVHTWRVGEILWFEFSPYDEPRLLRLVDARL